MSLDYELIGKGLIGLCGIAGAAWLWLQKARAEKANTDAKVEIAQSQGQVYEQLKERLSALDGQVARLTGEVDALRERVRVRDARIHTLELHIKDLEHFIRQQNLEPPKLAE